MHESHGRCVGGRYRYYSCGGFNTPTLASGLLISIAFYTYYDIMRMPLGKGFSGGRCVTMVIAQF